MGQILDLLQVDSNCTGIKVVRRARAPERSEVTRASLLSLAALGARACRTTFYRYNSRRLVASLVRSLTINFENTSEVIVLSLKRLIFKAPGV